MRFMGRLSIAVAVVVGLAVPCSAQTKVPYEELDLRAIQGKITPLTACYAGTIACGQVRTGRVSVDSCESNGLYAVGYSFDGTAGSVVTITGQSPEFAATIVLADGRSGNSTIYARNDVYTDGATARITNFTLPHTGPYIVMITPGVKYEFGNYTVTISCQTSGNPGTCSSNATTACLVANRFRVSTTYVNPIAGQTSAFKATKQDPLAVSPDVALFGFDDPRAIELVVRIVDARPFDNHFHIYYGGLTDFPFTISVTDTVKNTTKLYTFTGGTPGGGVDRSTFSTQ